jgi:hypothetical protein
VVSIVGARLAGEGDSRAVPKSTSVQILAGGGLIALLSRLLLGWYLRELRRVEIPEEPSEAIITYPLA